MMEEKSFTIRPSLHTAGKEEIDYFLSRAMEVLKETGVKVFHHRGVKLLGDHGAFVSTSGDGVPGSALVKIPQHLVEKALASAPKELTIYNRRGKPWMRLGGGNLGGFRTYYGTGSDLTHTYDRRTGELRLTLAEDIGDMAEVVEACDNIDFLMSYGIPSDVPLPKVYHHAFYQMVSRSLKPIVFTSDNGEVSEEIISMAALIAGGKEELKEKPFILNYSQPTSPLQHSEDALGKLFTCADAGIPVVYPPGIMPGASAPATPAGTIIQSLAEALSALVIHQLAAPGAPIVLCGAHGVMDMRTSINAYAAPERLKTEAVLASVYQHFGIPTWGFGGCTDSITLDEQAGMEFGLLTLWASLTGVNLAHDTGYLASGMAGDLRAVLWNDEIIDYTRNILLAGVKADRPRSAVETIRRVGPGGQFLGDDHTLKYFRSDMWEPRFLNRRNIAGWKAEGKQGLTPRLSQEIEKILGNEELREKTALPRDLDDELKTHLE